MEQYQIQRSFCSYIFLGTYTHGLTIIRPLYESLCLFLLLFSLLTARLFRRHNLQPPISNNKSRRSAPDDRFPYQGQHSTYNNAENRLFSFSLFDPHTFHISARIFIHGP